MVRRGRRRDAERGRDARGLRRGEPRFTTTSTTSTPAHVPADTLDTQLSSRSALRTLTTQSTHRQGIFLLHLPGLTYAEISSHLGLARTDVDHHITRSRQHLRLVRDQR